MSIPNTAAIREDRDKKIRGIARMALMASPKRRALKRDEIRKTLELDSREMGGCMDAAQELLRSVFGMEMVDIRPPCKISVESKTRNRPNSAVVESEEEEIMPSAIQISNVPIDISALPLSQSIHTQSAWILVNSIPTETRSKYEEEVSKIMEISTLYSTSTYGQEDQKRRDTQDGVLIAILCLLMTQSDGMLRKKQLVEYIQKLDPSLSTTYLEQDLLSEYVRSHYLFCYKSASVLPGPDDTIVQYGWGPRAKAEYPEHTMRAILRSIWPGLPEPDIIRAYKQHITAEIDQSNKETDVHHA